MKIVIYDTRNWPLDILEYKLTDNNIILGDIEKDRIISITLFCAKVSMYTAKIKDKNAYFSFKDLLNQYYIQTKLFVSITNNLEKFQNEWHLLNAE